MTTKTRLENFDIETLDVYEYQKFVSLIGEHSKTEILKMIIEESGDYENLSENLAQIAYEMEENE